MFDESAERGGVRKPGAHVKPQATKWKESVEKGILKESSPLDEVLKRMKNLLEILSDPEHVPRNILLIGQPHAGKSSFINLIHSCIRGRYEGLVESGTSHSGDNGSLTHHLRFLPNLGLSKRCLNQFRERYELSRDFVLPTIIDMPGIEVGADVIKYILCGAIPPNTELHEFMTGASIAPHLDLRNRKERQVDRVVFVASIKDDVNESLFRNAVKYVRGDQGKIPCIPYFLVITHVDQAQDPRLVEEKERKDNLLDVLLMRGEAKVRVQEVTNYCDEDDELDLDRDNAYVTNLKKHAQALSLLCKVMSRKEVAYPPDMDLYIMSIPLMPYTDFARHRRTNFVHYLRERRWNFWLLAVVVLIIAAVCMKSYKAISSIAI